MVDYVNPKIAHYRVIHNGESSPPAKNLLIPLHQEKWPPQNFYSPNPHPHPTPNSNFQVITQQNSIYSCRHCSYSIVWISYSLDKQVMLILILIDVQYSQKAIFSFKKGSNHQNHSSSGSFDPVKKFPQ